MSKSENKKSPQAKAKKAIKKMLKELGMEAVVMPALPEDKLGDKLCDCGSVGEAIELAVKNAKHMDDTDCLNWHLTIMALAEKIVVKGMIAHGVDSGQTEQEATAQVLGYVRQIYARASSLYEKHEATIMEKL